MVVGPFSEPNQPIILSTQPNPLTIEHSWSDPTHQQTDTSHAATPQKCCQNTTWCTIDANDIVCAI